jgi:hypothetical protein
MADGNGKSSRKTPTEREHPRLSAAAIERGRQIANDAPPVSAALLAELRLIIWGGRAP